MAAGDKIGRCTSCAWSSTSGSGTSPITNINGWSYDDGDETVAHTEGSARVDGLYKGKTVRSVTIDTDDALQYSLIDIGDSFVNLALTVESAVESDGTAVGGTLTLTMSRVVCTAKGTIGKDNQSSSPNVASLTFTLARAASAGTDPTVTWSFA